MSYLERRPMAKILLEDRVTILIMKLVRAMSHLNTLCKLILCIIINNLVGMYSL